MGPLGATVPSVEAFLFVFLTSRRLNARSASTDGTVPPGGGAGLPGSVGGRPSDPLGATAPSGDAFRCGLAPRGLGRSLVACRGSSLGPLGSKAAG